MRGIARWMVRIVPSVVLVVLSVALGRRVGETLPERFELPALILAILAVAGFYITRARSVWDYLMLAVMAVTLGIYGALVGILDRGARSWAVVAAGVALAGLIGLVLRPQRGRPIIFAFTVGYVLTWLLVASVSTAPVVIRSLASIGWLLFVAVGAFVIAGAAADWEAIRESRFAGDLLIVSANLMLTGVVALG